MTEQMLFVVLLATCLHFVLAVFSPNVTISSCTSNAVVVRVKDAADGGIIYIQGRGLECRETTVSHTRDYTFPFDTCGLQYDEKFRVVVQKRPHLQTGFDKVIPVMCFLDTSDLLVTGVIYPEERTDKSVNKTVKPTVLMGIRTDGSEENLREVTLNDNIRLVVRLGDQYLSDFDIKAKECTAALIPVVSNECSADEELFPNFKKSAQGVLTTDFQAFQPTNLGDDDSDVDVSFTCNVAVCKGTCEKTVCGEILGWGRKKRNDDHDDIIERVTVGTTIRVKSPPSEESAMGKKQTDFCAGKVLVTSVTTLTGITLVFSWTVCGCILSKLLRLEKRQPGPTKPSTLRRLSEKNINFARSVGRRLSSMFNMPFGYDVRDPKMMGSIPEMYPTPPTKRRESVTVSTSSTNEHTDNDDVSIATSCTCELRRRLVSSGSQTESGSEFGDMDTNLFTSQSPYSHMRSNNPITSLSIKSYSRSGSLETNELLSIRPDHTNVKILPASVTQVDGSDVISFDSDTASRDVEYFTADEIPRTRETRANRSANFDFEPDIDYPLGPTGNASNMGVITVDKSKTPTVPRSDKAFTGGFPYSDKHPTDDNVYTTVGAFHDEADITSDEVGGQVSTRFEPESSRENDPRRGTSLLNSFISTSKKKIGQVADAIATLPNKNKFDLAGSGQKTAARRDSSDADGVTVMKINEKSKIGDIACAANCANDQNQDENYYEPIYFGNQMKIERKLSTHV